MLSRMKPINVVNAALRVALQPERVVSDFHIDFPNFLSFVRLYY